MTTSESKGRFFLQNESIRTTNQIESIRIANWNALVGARVWLALETSSPWDELTWGLLDWVTS